jgi:transcriptional regulator with XRE-family HTH domain
MPTPRKPNPQKRGRKPTWRNGNLEQAKKPRKRKMVRADRLIARPVGPPEKWRKENLSIIQTMVSMGMTQREIAEALQVRRETIWAWQRKHPELTNALRAGAEIADARVEASIYERAVGYEYRTEKVFQYRGEPVRIETKAHVPADPQLAIFWLKNRQPERWKDRMEVQHAHLFNFVGMLPSEEEWRERYAPAEAIDIKTNLPAIEEDKDS